MEWNGADASGVSLMCSLTIESLIRTSSIDLPSQSKRSTGRLSAQRNLHRSDTTGWRPRCSLQIRWPSSTTFREGLSSVWKIGTFSLHFKRFQTAWSNFPRKGHGSPVEGRRPNSVSPRALVVFEVSQKVVWMSTWCQSHDDLHLNVV